MAYSQAYDNLAWQIAREVFGDSALAQVFYRMMRQESGFDSDVVEGRRASSAGAQGIAQFMPATAREEGIDPLNPEEALRGAAAYLRKLISYLGGQVAKGVAAYNAGAGRVEKAVAAGGSNWASYLPVETQTYLAITQPEGVTAMANGTFDPGAVSPWEREYGVSGLAQAGQGTAAGDVIPWMTPFFRDKTYTLESGATLTKTAEQQASDAFADDPMKWISLWRSETGQEGAVSEAEKASTAYTRILAREVIETLGGTTYEQGRQRILDRLDQEHWTAEQAISEFRGWMEGALEAGKRAETVYGEKMRRAAYTTPTPYWPGDEPGGPRAQWTEKYGVPYTPSPGVPVSELPDLEQMYSQWHQNLGISQQAPPIPQTMGAAGYGMGQDKGYEAARAFLQRMNLRSGAPQGAPQGAGF